MPMIEIVAATRLTEEEFWNRSALGISLRRLAQDTRLVARIAYANHRGLPDIYNARIAAAGAEDVLVFMHDDVWIDDYFFGDRVVDGVQARGARPHDRAAAARHRAAFVFRDPVAMAVALARSLEALLDRDSAAWHMWPYAAELLDA